MFIFLLLILLFQLTGTFILCKVMRKRRKLFQERFAMTLATCASSVMSLSISMMLTIILDMDFMTLVPFTVLLGCGIGWGFGSLFKYQSLLSGLYNGSLGAIMGTMFGAVILNPELCGLPAEAGANIMMLSLFSLATSVLTLRLIFHALRV